MSFVTKLMLIFALKLQLVQQSLHPAKTTGWAAICSNKLIGPFFSIKLSTLSAIFSCWRNNVYLKRKVPALKASWSSCRTVLRHTGVARFETSWTRSFQDHGWINEAVCVGQHAQQSSVIDWRELSKMKDAKFKFISPETFFSMKS